MSGNASRVAGETYIDSNANSIWDINGSGQYNGVLNSPPNVNTKPENTVHIRESLVQVLSTSDANITSLRPAAAFSLSHCIDGTPFTNVARTVSIAVRDTNSTVFAGNTLPGNILPAGTKIDFITSNGTILSTPSFTVPNTSEPSSPVWTYAVTVQSDAIQSNAALGYTCNNPTTSGIFTVKVTTPLGIITTQSFSITD
jgi:hypothetical protein